MIHLVSKSQEVSYDRSKITNMYVLSTPHSEPEIHMLGL